jgi:hypothetical protein
LRWARRLLGARVRIGWTGAASSVLQDSTSDRGNAMDLEGPVPPRPGRNAPSDLDSIRRRVARRAANDREPSIRLGMPSRAGRRAERWYPEFRASAGSW